jgi:hypothetical protein
MKMLRTEIEQKRAAWWAEHCQPGISFSEALRLNEQLIGLFPMTDEERKQRMEDMKNMTEFVL